MTFLPQILFFFLIIKPFVWCLKGPNICITQVFETKLVNVSFIETKRVQETDWCWQLIPRCLTWKNTLVKKFKPQNITRLVNEENCCSGFRSLDGLTCEPHCDKNPCVFGTCTQPNVCECTPGYSGSNCSILGCQNSQNYGSNCSLSCNCLHNGRCDPISGACSCLPGYSGSHCQNTCSNGTYGLHCSEKCNCLNGEKCHFITGDCLPCSAGSYGKDCKNKCDCHVKGTALCYHGNGKCFCNPNWFGDQCQNYCPFGVRFNGSCLSLCESCSSNCEFPEYCEYCTDNCTSYIYSSYSSSSQNNEITSSSVSPLIWILFPIIVILFLIIIFLYKRQVNRLQKDLESRSIKCLENDIRHSPSVKTVFLNNELETNSNLTSKTYSPPLKKNNNTKNTNVNNTNVNKLMTETCIKDKNFK